jgi:hypothetical protein
LDAVAHAELRQHAGDVRLDGRFAEPAQRRRRRVVRPGCRRDERRAVARWISLGLPLAYIATIPASRVGGGLVAGAFWIAVGALLATGTLARRPLGQVAVAS